MKLLRTVFFFLIVFALLSAIGEAFGQDAAEGPGEFPLAGADESTPAYSHYFSWINNTNEGSTEAQTLANLEFFRWMHDEYGMTLDIYAFDAGVIDAPRYYGDIESDRFYEHFPNGLDPIYEKAKSFGCRLGVWLGPDGYGETSAEEEARREMLVRLCRDYDFILFKVDAVCGQLRDEKQQAFIETMQACREYSPDLIILNHRLNLGEGVPHVTTKLWGGEAYIDVWRSNGMSATHNRACSVAMGLPTDEEGNPVRLREDHGVCLSSELDYWEDSLFIQTFSRNLILGPETYGSPWFLRDDELPKLARIHNLSRRYRDIMINGMMLPSEQYGWNAVSRGDEGTRVVSLRNAEWEPVARSVTLDESIGLTGDGPFEVRRMHPSEEILGRFEKGESVEIVVPAFRAVVLIASNAPPEELGVEGSVYEVVRDVEGRPAEIDILGLPGTEATIRLPETSREFGSVSLDGRAVNELLQGEELRIEFPGETLSKPIHRKLADLASSEIPEDAEGLYEATVFAADNNALEIRSKLRSGPTEIPAVRDARDAFFGQDLLVQRGVWDRYLFDGDLDTYFRLRTGAIWGGALRIDLGESQAIDRFLLRRVDASFVPEEAHVSNDLIHWKSVSVVSESEDVDQVNVLRRSYTVDQEWIDVDVHRLTIELGEASDPFRYVRIPGAATNVGEIEAYRSGETVDRSTWRASNAFAAYPEAPAKLAWSAEFLLDEAAPNSYITIACNGKHGRDSAYAAMRIDGQLVGAPRRAVSYPANPWEYGNSRRDANLSYFFPVTEDMIGKTVEAVVLQFEEKNPRESIELGQIEPEAWISTYPSPCVSMRLVLTRE
jgi:hypothetical protein